MTTASTLISVGLLLSGLYLAFSKKPASTLSAYSSLPLKSLYATIRLNIQNYKKTSKEKNLHAVAEKVDQLQSNKNQKASKIDKIGNAIKKLKES